MASSFNPNSLVDIFRLEFPVFIDKTKMSLLKSNKGSKKSIASHFGTFQLADEGLEDVPQDLDMALSKFGISPESFTLPKEGEFYIF